jgi:tetratricopeptide (TPR) repeat protein
MILRSGSMFWAAFVLLIAASGCARSPEAKRNKFMNSGRHYLEKHEYARAVLDFRNAVAAMPGDGESFYQLGLAYVGARDLQGAWNSFKTALALDPKHKGAQLNLSKIEVSMPGVDMVRQAKAHLSELLEGSPGDPTALNLLALSELKLGDTQGAEKHLRHALAAAPRSLVNFGLLAQARLAQNDPKGAEDVLDQACRSNPGSADPLLLLAQFHLAMNQLPQAEQALQKAIGVNPNHPVALLLLGKLQAGTGRNEQAEQTFKHLASLNDAAAKPVYAMYLFGAGRVHEAIAELERLAKADPSDRGARTRLVAAYWHSGRNQEAEQLLNKVLKKNASDVDALIQRAELYLASDKYAEAQTDLYEAMSVKPNSPAVHHRLARLHQLRRNPAGQRQELFEVLKLIPANVEARIELAQSFLTDKSGKTALDILNQAPVYQKDLPEVIVQRNWALWSVGDIAGFRRGTEAGLAQRRSSDLLIQQGLLEMHEGRHTAARAALDEALRMNPLDIRAVEGLRRSYVAQNQTALALQRVEEFAAGHPRSAPVQTFLGTVLAQNGEKAKARTALEAARVVDPGFESAQIALVKLDHADGRLDSAATRLDALLGANPSNTMARYWLGNIEADRGNFQKAITHFEHVIEADPANAQALNNLAYLLSSLPNRTDEALKYAQKAQELAPNNPNFADTLGWALYRKGLYSMAARHLELAASNRDGNPVSRFHLAMAYAKAGDSKKGRITLQAALERYPELPEAKVAKDVVEQMAAR